MNLKIKNKKSDNFATSTLIMLGHKLLPHFNMVPNMSESDLYHLVEKTHNFLDQFSYFQNGNWFRHFDYCIESLDNKIKVTVSVDTNFNKREMVSCIYSFSFDGVIDHELNLDFDEK